MLLATITAAREAILQQDAVGYPEPLGSSRLKEWDAEDRSAPCNVAIGLDYHMLVLAGAKHLTDKDT